ncbi:MAG: acetyl-CoA carboxylase biotin carboxyl carrier protein subunit [Eubacteriales bacterium]|nr:acetyl-CoA carboxylase biotin carboxyl carrier protein subunit [Eubacteriales bacterium]
MDFTLNAHMPGLVARVTCEVGQEVEENQELVVLNCMKTEISCLSPKAGKVKEILVAEWDEMDVDVPMIVLEEV